jgi:hypothetical protein
LTRSVKKEVIDMVAMDRTMIRFGMAIVLLAAAGIWSCWPSSRVLAIEDPESSPVPFGLALGQTVRLNILNKGQERGCVIYWKFLDSAGRVLAEDPQRQIIPPGQFVSIDVDGSGLGTMGDRFGRIQLRAVVTAAGNPVTKNLKVSLEVFDNETGRTSFVISPPPEPE